MISTKFLQGFKKHQRYFYLSIILIVGFFVGSALITPKITLVTENLLKDIIEQNIDSKKKVIKFEFTRLNNFLEYSEILLNDSSEVPFDRLKENLQFTTEMAKSSKVISNTFIFSVNSQGMVEVHMSESLNSSTDAEIPNFSKQLKDLTQEALIDTIIKTPTSVINRKAYLKKINPDTTVVVGYDINLMDFWLYFALNYPAQGGYSVVTNERGICLLHPDPKYIGKKLDGFLGAISIKDVLKHEGSSRSPDSPSFLKDTATSEYLDLEVVRYFDQIDIENNSLILIESFPIDIHLKETTRDVKQYFSWISILAFLAFIGLLVISRFQLKEKYVENLKVLGDKERLLHANEKYQKENAVLQLNQLKKKINPHFLFNSLNSLHVLIETKPELSKEFVLKLADVYRYFLEHKEGNLITIRKEINFLKQYVFLQEIRFKSSLNVSIVNKCDDLVLSKKIPFLSLETLVENAIKHNVITKDNPLYIDIFIYSDAIVVSNNYTPRKKKDNDSHNIGLSYLKDIYLHHQVNSFKTEIIDGNFKCTLPLLP